MFKTNKKEKILFIFTTLSILIATSISIIIPIVNLENQSYVELNIKEINGGEINFKDEDLKLDVLLQNKSMHIYRDSMLIARALSNLINNALKYSKEDTVVNINLKEERIDEINYGIFSIENIPRKSLSEKEVHNLFKRLYKVDKSRNEEGSELGLAITQEIIKAHNGFIETKLIE